VAEKVSVNYVVACFLGERRSMSIKDPRVFIETHLDWLSDNNIHIDRVSVMLNAENEKQINDMQNIVDSYSPYYVELKTFVRPNRGHSYGLWNTAISTSIEKREGFTHFFLVEDDYVPCRTDFLDVFMSHLTEKNAFVCQKVHEGTPGGFQRHASVSNGLLDAAAAESVMRKIGQPLSIQPSFSYTQAEFNQQYFTNGLVENGYTFSDTSDVAATEFLKLNPLDYSEFSIQIMDEEAGPPLLQPIYDKDML
jgi:hypothetical protein